ncbi:hypothetical protein GGI25_003282 [Coemansia spiralis]|uniref:BHLH domain-containing protein n=2 Tax=Coemansia TaxID=4863 RepID=A0A9W8G7H1_9FUNG|nr:hypothetical protein BX070DRAFT_231201 [Coemansia spiralis]KAJ1989994.1 hypothetical protein EDC05_004346 [Coemansia umbellata]KAJ2677185.1 hypothetical protein GGI25_003282 [Coemansia spiralis]
MADRTAKSTAPPTTAAQDAGLAQGAGLAQTSIMSPLHIGMEGLTDKQAAEVVELLTPFLSPVHSFQSHPATPLVLQPRVFSPLTSPALPSQMPPPSPSITAEHIMRRQGLSADKAMRAAAGRRGHPYKASQKQSRSPQPTDEEFLDSLAASLQNTPLLPLNSQTLSSDALTIHLPDSVLQGMPETRDRTLHQLNASPEAGQQMDDCQALQLENWLGAIPLSQATPASLMNLPASAHHLPHTSTGEIIAVPAPAPAAVQPPAIGMAAESPEQLLVQSAPMPAQFAHPPLPPPLQIGPSAYKGTEDGQSRGRGRRKSIGTAKRISRSRSRPSLLSPRTTPLVPSILKSPASPEAQPIKPADIRRTPIVAATSTTNIVGLEADVVTRLATKSNYQNILEGHSEQLGLTYHEGFKTGLEKRRTNHKQAEQKRRDSLKVCFQALRERLPNVDDRLVSKIYLLDKANTFIDRMRRANEMLAEAARAKGVDVDSIMKIVLEEEEEEGEGEGEGEETP